MSYFKQNYSFIKKNYPNLLNIIEENQAATISVVRTVTKNDEPNLAIRKDGREYFLHSRYNAHSEAQKWVSTILNQSESPVEWIVLFGLGLGYYLEELLQLPELKQIYIIEPSISVFNELLDLRDIRSFMSNPKIKLLGVGSEEILLAVLAREISSSLSESRLVTLAPPIYEQLYPELYNNFIDQFKQSIYDQIENFYTAASFQNLWTYNVMSNAPYMLMSPSFKLFKGFLQDTTVLIVGSGPSLEQDVEYLLQLRNKCFIIAAGSSIQALQRNGIEPHLIVSMDGGERNLNVFKHIDTSKTPLLFFPHIHSGILDIYDAKLTNATYEFDTISEYMLGYKNPLKLLNSTTVTGAAIQAAAFIGASRIIFMGQDLSYPNKKMYASGVNYIPLEEQQRVGEEADLEVENVYGGVNATTRKMLTTLRDLEHLIKFVSLKDVEFINTSKAGAQINGTTFIPMEILFESLSMLPNKDFNIDNFIVDPTVEEQLEEFKLLSTKFQFILKQTKSINKKADLLKEELGKVSNYLNQRKKSKIPLSLQMINKLWLEITSSDIFEVFFSFSRMHHINIYKRYIPKIVEASDVIEKAELIHEHLGKLNDELLDFINDFNKILDVTMERFESFSSKLTSC